MRTSAYSCRHPVQRRPPRLRVAEHIAPKADLAGHPAVPLGEHVGWDAGVFGRTGAADCAGAEQRSSSSRTENEAKSTKPAMHCGLRPSEPATDIPTRQTLVEAKANSLVEDRLRRAYQRCLRSPSRLHRAIRCRRRARVRARRPLTTRAPAPELASTAPPAMRCPSRGESTAGRSQRRSTSTRATRARRIADSRAA